MKLQQFKYILGVVNHDLNVSKAAESFFTSQPGVSRQIRMLEEELNIKIFERHGKLLTGITPVGKEILAIAAEVSDRIEGIKRIAQEYSNESHGSLTIATTHTQARYVLPKTILDFTNKFSDVSFHMQQGTPIQISESASNGSVDFAIASEAMEQFSNLVTMPCYSWNRILLVRSDHPLVNEENLTLKKIAEYPLVTYINGFTGRYQLDNAFKKASVTPKIMFTAADADIIKAYVKMKLGVGIIASVAYEPEFDADLVSIDVSHLFDTCITKIAVKRGVTLRKYMYEFIALFAPHLTENLIDAAMGTKNNDELNQLFKGVTVPHY